MIKPIKPLKSFLGLSYIQKMKTQTINKIYNYKDFKQLERSIKRKNTLSDYYKVNGIIYTQDNYDFEGREVSYTNKRTFKSFIVKTSNRYGQTKFKDVQIEDLGEVGYYRNDITYID